MEDADYSAGGAMYAREHIATSLCGRNEITWTLHMRSGDTITLTVLRDGQTFDVDVPLYANAD